MNRGITFALLFTIAATLSSLAHATEETGLGVKANALKAAIKKSFGETLRLKIKHGDAEHHEVQMVGITKPVGS